MRLVADYALEPLVLVQSDQSTREVVGSTLVADLGVSYALFHRLLVYAHLPVASASSDELRLDRGVDLPAPEEGAGLGDARLGARAQLAGPLERGLQLAAAAELFLPTGDEARYSGDGSFRGRFLAIAGASFSKLQASLQVGAGFRGAERLPGILPTRVGRTLVAGVSLRAPLDRRGRIFVGPELDAELGVGDGAKLFDPRSTVAHVLLALRSRPFLGALELGAAVGPGLGQGAGSADARVIAFVGWSPEAPPPPPDADSDGVPDAADICLNLPGEPSNDPLMNGCPEAPLDSDGDSIPDGFDACPREPGEATADRRSNGCPRRAEPEPEVSPKTPPAASVVEREIVISEQVQFETGTAVLRAESDAILGAVARALGDHPDIGLLEVQGHTDDRGTPELNRRLSEERASAVAEWLVLHGVAASRLRAAGYGQSRPLADNTTEQGRARNRRVEFRIILRKPKPEVKP
jgi:outer membrane protein OmpA-like peptidoglycan-associated protein